MQASTEDADVWHWVAFATEVLGLLFTLYVMWEYMPERYKMTLRAWARVPRAPFDAHEARRRERAEMLGDVVHLITYGVPDEWATS